MQGPLALLVAGILVAVFVMGLTVIFATGGTDTKPDTSGEVEADDRPGCPGCRFCNVDHARFCAQCGQPLASEND